MKLLKIFCSFLFVSSMVCMIIAIFVKKYFLDYENVPNAINIESVDNRIFDYIIVGSGTAGSVLAYELSRNTNDTVLLIEAGENFNALSIVPIFSTMMQGSKFDWMFKSVPQKYSSRGLENQRQSLPRGKGLGGSHQINYLLHFNGKMSDFDQWANEGGATEWSYEHLKDYLIKHDNLRSECDEFCCCVSDEEGYQNITKSPKLKIEELDREDSILGDAFQSAADELLSKNITVDFKLAKFTTFNGKRHSVYHEYLKRAFYHENLRILMKSRVIKVEFNTKKEATSVLVSSAGKVFRVYVKKEIVLSAGAFQSPQILMLSGIGDQDHLKKVGVNLVHYSPNVGQNLFDHMNFPLFISINQSASVNVEKILSVKEIWKYLRDGKGILSNTAVVGLGESGDSGIILFGMGSADEVVLRSIANFKQEVFRAFFPFYYNSSQEGFIFLSTCHQPKSRGSVKLDPKNVLAYPLIDPNYLHEFEDIICIKKSISLVRETLNTSKFKSLGVKINWPKLRECSNFGPFLEDFETNMPSERYLECLIRSAALTAHHVGGTCSIGGTDAVVDNHLRVRGVKKLRVVDASVFPYPVSGTPNSIIIALSERAAKLIKDDSNKY